MLKIFIESFKLTNKSIILATPLIVFCSLFWLYYSYVSLESDSISKHIFSLVTTFVVLSGLTGSWLYFVKKGLSVTKQVYVFDRDRNNALKSLFMCLFKGFGRLFLPISGFIALNIIIFCLIFSGIAYLTITFPQIKNNIASIWLVIFYIVTFITIMWIPEIVYNEKNALYALYNSIIKVYTQFKDTMTLYIFILAVITAILALIYFFINIHPIISFVLIMILYYIILYVVVLLFTYYEHKFLSNKD